MGRRRHDPDLRRNSHHPLADRRPENRRPPACHGVTCRNFRILATDLDGTLLHTGGGITPRNRDAIRLAEQAGLDLVVCTGRRHSFALQALGTLPLAPASVLISSNGAVVRTVAGDLLSRSTLPLPLVRRLLLELQEFRNALVFTFDRIGPDGEEVAGALLLEEFHVLHGSIQRWMEANAASIRRVSPLENAFLQTSADAASAQILEPIQAMFCGTIERMLRAERILRERFHVEVDTFRTEYPTRDLCILDILPRGRSKGAALLELAASRGMDPARILAIGDNWNDESMFRVSGSSVLMGNAPDELKRMAVAAGWKIGLPADEDGFAAAVEIALERRLTPSSEHPSGC